MSVPTVWLSNITQANSTTVPTSLSDPNVVDVRRYKEVLLSATISGTQQLQVDVYVWVPASAAFIPLGLKILLDAAYQNLAILPSTGLYVGFVTTPRGGATGYSLAVGGRNDR